jgi:hypothetical protein
MDLKDPQHKLKLYELLVSQLHKYQNIIWQIPTALVVGNYVVIDRFSSNPVYLLALWFFNWGILFVLYRMVKTQRSIIRALRIAEKNLYEDFKDFIPKFGPPHRLFSPFYFLFTLFLLQIGLLVSIGFHHNNIPSSSSIKCQHHLSNVNDNQKNECCCSNYKLVVGSGCSGPSIKNGLEMIYREQLKQTNVLETIKITPQKSSNNEATIYTGISVKLWLYIISGLICLCGLFLIFLPNMSSSMLLVGKILFSIGSISLISELSLGGITLNYQKIESPKPIVTAVHWQLIYTLGPFEEGKDTIYQPQKIGELFAALRVNTLEKVQLLMIVGRVDKRPLKPYLTAILGSNENLARMRAKAVKRMILNEHEFTDLGTKILTMSSAAENFGLKVPQNLLEEDRCVEVYALIQVNSEKPN